MWWPNAPLRFSLDGQKAFFGLLFATALISGASWAFADKTNVTIGGSFSLSAPDGSTVTDETYRGKWLLVFFGYTSCPDLCPMTLNAIAGVLETFGAAAGQLQPIFITVDPDRDTPDVMVKFTKSFDPRIVGLTGSTQQITAVEKKYGAYSELHKAGAASQNYLVDHSTYIYIMSPLGKFVRAVAFDTPSDQISQSLRQLMAQTGE